MKRNRFLFIIILSIFLFSKIHAQNKDNTKSTSDQEYAKLWRKVDSFRLKGLPESALKIIDKIYNKTKKEKEPAQQVKALLYKNTIKSSTSEQEYSLSILELKAQADSSEFPVTPLLHSIIADNYWEYYQRNRYKFYNRTQTVNFNPKDIATWDLKKIVEETIKEYQLSLSDPEKLKGVKIDIYDDILQESEFKEGRKFRPTLYDFLAHRAIDFFMENEPNITKPAEEFLINKSQYFLPANSFSKIEVTSKDSLSFKYYALKLFQDLIQFHLNDPDASSLIDVDLKRINFIYQNSILAEKDQLYLASLEDLEKRSISLPVSTQASYYIAKHWLDKSNNYKPLLSADHKWDAKKAEEICKAAMLRFPKSFGANNCEGLLNQINRKELDLQAGKTNIPQHPFLCHLKYKNLPKVYVRVIKTTKKEMNQFGQLAQEYYQKNKVWKSVPEILIDYYANRAAAHTFSIDLPIDGDFQTHSVEAKIPALPTGLYIIMMSSDEKLGSKNQIVNYVFTTITNITAITRPDELNNIEMFVMNRETGFPINNAQVKIIANTYVNYKNIRSVEGPFKTDTNGFVLIKAKKTYRQLEFEITTPGDFYSSKTSTLNDEYEYNDLSQYELIKDTLPKMETRSLIFTDRAIYRPGQTVYYKGIVMQTDYKKINKIIPNHQINVKLYDVNNKEISHAELVTNDFGSYTGSFIAPASGINGQMKISDGYNEQLIYIEEYKRPKFEVIIDTPKDSYKVNDEVTVKGRAKSYSATNVDHAQVRYRVTRTTNYNYWYFSKSFLPFSNNMEITSGTIQTDEQGEFKISFNAIPDLSVQKESLTYFNYSIHVDVTDINGETRSSNSIVSVGYKSLLVDLNIPEEVLKERSNEFKISTTNLNGEFVPTKGSITIYSLKQPTKPYRERLWEQPDLHVMSKEEFEKDFPYDQYNDENDFMKWEKKNKVIDENFDTGKERLFKLPVLTSWNQGRYVIEMNSKDKNGEEVVTKKYFTLISTKEQTLPYPTINYFVPLINDAQPGDTANTIIGTSESTARILYEVAVEGKSKIRKYLSLSNEQKLLQEKIYESYRGNISINYTLIKHNRAFTETHSVYIPYTNKELDISFETFRDKLEPGAKEQWKIKIKGKNGEQVSSELLATLYDASLDQFRKNSWAFDIYTSYEYFPSWNISNGGFEVRTGIKHYPGDNSTIFTWYGYDQLKSYDYYTLTYQWLDENQTHVAIKSESKRNKSKSYEGFRSVPKGQISGFATADSTAVVWDLNPMYLNDGTYKVESLNASANFAYSTASGGGLGNGSGFGAGINKDQEPLEAVKARTHFNETAFFYPQLQTDEEGSVIINFTMPEALTRWKMLGLAHTKDLKYSLTENELVTRKELMVVPNAPRFFREGDKVFFSSKISNVSENDLTGNAQLMLFDALTMKPIDRILGNNHANKSFEIKAGLSTSLQWEIQIPENIQAITYKVVAKAGNYSDGEESTLPVLSNRTLVTESLPIWIGSNQTKSFKLDKLVNNNSKTLTHQKLTLEFTSNPAWYAIQSLPYLMEFPYECAEQVFSRFYANSIASHIVNSDAAIKKVFEKWKQTQPNALKSNLEKNQELKGLLLEETPWVREGDNESERKRRVGVLFDLTKMSFELDKTLQKLVKMQKYDGSWPWFDNMPSDRYITQHVITGLGHLDHLGVKSIKEDKAVWSMTKKGISYLDKQIRKDYEELKKQEVAKFIKLSDNHISAIQIHYLYMRSFFKNVSIDKSNEEAVNYFKSQAKTYWVQQSKYLQGMIALALHRDNDIKTPGDIVKSLREFAIHSEEMGMYWKQEWSYFWYLAPVETQSLLIEVFDEVAKDQKAVDGMNVWLLKQKQTQDWKTTKATADACYALLLKGSNLLSTDVKTKINVGNITVDPATMNDSLVEAGTGYFKTSWTTSEIKNEMGNITVTKSDNGTSWGGLYWQYLENLDKITPHETPLQLKRQLFLEQPSATGPVISPINNKTTLKPGDLIKVRIELRVDRTMEYVHMKDMRAAGLEPVNVLSQYKYQDGLSYYESTKDAATNFFFAYLPKGTYVFEYPLRVSLEGDFSNGITTIQCMYAPEFTSHSEGVRIKICK